VAFSVIHLLQVFSDVKISYSCAAADKISTDIARRAVPLRSAVAELLVTLVLTSNVLKRGSDDSLLN